MSKAAFRPCEQLSRRQREATPLPFAEYLLARVRQIHGCHTVAVLWVQRQSVYVALDGVDCWDRERDARRYDGPYPVVAHPPCGPWGKYAHNCHQSKEDGRVAMTLVHRWGGVVEQPVGSSLFRLERGWPSGEVEYVEQGRFGHQARKPTLLYFMRRP